MKPRASFVIPAYNAECWISKAIHSCRSQSLKQIEIVVVNDGSTDATGEIINFHAKQDKRIIPVHLKENAGRSEARNIGNHEASGDIIMVLDADDMATRNRARDTLAFFESRKPDVVWGSFFVIDSLGIVGQKISCSDFRPEIQKQQRMNFICHSTMAYRKGVTLNVRYDSGEYSKLGLDDWKFQWDCYHKGYSMKPIKSVLAYYRQTKSGTMGTRDEKEVSRVKDAYFNVTV